MKNKVFISVIALGFLVPGFALAQGEATKLTPYTLLAPIPIGEGGTLVETTDANSYISGLFTLLVSLAAVFAVVRLIYAGIIYMSSDAFQNKSEAKVIITETFWGLAFVIGAWVIVATILQPKDGEFVFKLSLPVASSTDNTNFPGSSGPGSLTLTQEQATQALRAAGVELNGPILVAGLRQATIDELGRLKTACGCTVLVTSATGGTHATGTYSHANGYKVDLRSDREGTALTNYITSTYQALPDRSDGAKMYQAPSGAIYALEGNHWDVVVR